jgi:hypothetical protein
VEALRREVELLRLNLEVVLEKVRSQEAELREFRAAKDAKVRRLNLNTRARSSETLHLFLNNIQSQSGGGAVKQAEDAVRALRAARDPEARRQATEALEKALKVLKDQAGATPQGK